MGKKIIIEDEHKVRREVSEAELATEQANIKTFNEANPKGRKIMEMLSDSADETVYKIKVRMEM